MRLTLPCAALAVAMLSASQAQVPVTATADYAALVNEYITGNADEAVVRMVALGRQGLDDGFKEFIATAPTARLLTGAAALLTEAGLRSPVDIAAPVTNRYLDLAAAMVDIGTPPRMARLGAVDLRKSALPALPAQFRRLWYLTVISSLQTGGRTPEAQVALENARALFPRDPEFLLLSGIGEEMRATNRMVVIGESDRGKALGYAEVYLRASLELAPDRLEARLRLGRVLSQRGRADEARGLLTTVSETADARLSYLASLFLGGLEDAAGNTARAADWYARAAAKVPAAQAATIAASELQHRAGDRHAAAVSLASALGPNREDPWWSYLFGEYWRIDICLNALRGMARS